MQYVLGVGFIVNKYKKNPRVRIFLDDQMIDEHELDKNNVCGRPLEVDQLTWKLVDWEDDSWTIVQKVKVQGNKPILHTWKDQSHTKFLPEDLDKTPKYFKLYHIDDSMLEGKKQISLEILNTDSNYTNGFMTRSTTIDIRHVFLLPMELIKHFKSRAEEFHSHMSKVIPKEFDGLCNPKFCHHGHEHTHSLGYPFPIEYKWQMSEEKYDKRENMFLHKVGGSGVLTLALSKMNGVITFNHETLDRVLHSRISNAKDDDEYAVVKAMQINGATPKEITRKLDQRQIQTFPFSLNFFGLVRTGLLDKYIV
jgi:hypothetical protein